MTGKIMPLRERDTSTVQAAADAFLSSPRYANPNTRSDGALPRGIRLASASTARTLYPAPVIRRVIRPPMLPTPMPTGPYRPRS